MYQSNVSINQSINHSVINHQSVNHGAELFVYLLKDSCAVDDVSNTLNNLEHAQRVGLDVTVFQQTGVMEVEVCEDSLCQ